jgi:hypothetical protein
MNKSRFSDFIHFMFYAFIWRITCKVLFPWKSNEKHLVYFCFSYHWWIDSKELKKEREKKVAQAITLRKWKKVVFVLSWNFITFIPSNHRMQRAKKWEKKEKRLYSMLLICFWTSRHRMPINVFFSSFHIFFPKKEHSIERKSMSDDKWIKSLFSFDKIKAMKWKESEFSPHFLVNWQQPITLWKKRWHRKMIYRLNEHVFH